LTRQEFIGDLAGLHPQGGGSRSPKERQLRVEERPVLQLPRQLAAKEAFITSASLVRAGGWLSIDGKTVANGKTRADGSAPARDLHRFSPAPPVCVTARFDFPSFPGLCQASNYDVQTP